MNLRKEFEDKTARIQEPRGTKRVRPNLEEETEEFPLPERIKLYLLAEKNFLSAKEKLLSKAHLSEEALNLVFQSLRFEKSPSTVVLVSEAIEEAKKNRKGDFVLVNEIIKKRKPKKELTELQKEMEKLKSKQSKETKRFIKDRAVFENMNHDASLRRLSEIHQDHRRRLKTSMDVKGFISGIRFYGSQNKK